MDHQFELSQVMQYVSSELREADQAAQGNAIMQFDECEVEFAVKIEAVGKAGLKVWVVELGADAKREQSNTVKIKYKAIAGKPVQAPQVGETSSGASVERQPQNRTDIHRDPA